MGKINNALEQETIKKYQKKDKKKKRIMKVSSAGVKHLSKIISQRGK